MGTCVGVLAASQAFASTLTTEAEMARPKKTPKGRRTRINMRVPSELVLWAKKYAKTKHMTFTQVIVQLLTDLQAEEA